MRGQKLLCLAMITGLFEILWKTPGSQTLNKQHSFMIAAHSECPSMHSFNGKILKPLAQKVQLSVSGIELWEHGLIFFWSLSSLSFACIRKTWSSGDI